MTRPRALTAATLALGLVISLGLASVGAPVGAATCGPAPSGQIAVVVVVDTGAGQPAVDCVMVPAGAKGADALMATHRVRNDSFKMTAAFICGIDGVPTTGCAEDASQPSWNYWSGRTGSWTFQTLGAFSYRLPDRCAVEGWRFGPKGSQPRTSVPAVDCAAPPPTTQVPPATAAPGGAAPPIKPPAVPAPNRRVEGSAPRSTAAPLQPTDGGTPAERAGPPDAPQSTTTTDDAGVGGTEALPDPVPTSTPGRASVESDLASVEVEDPPGGPGTGVIIAVGVVAAMTGIAVRRHRSPRRAEESIV